MIQERKKNNFIRKLSFILNNIIDDPKIIISILDINLPSKKGNMFVYLSIFPDDKKDEIIRILRKESLKIKNRIKKLKVLRYLPRKIFFKYDQSLKFMQEIDKILRN
ncbi:MAG: hypothetical protein KatS3mg095_0024 [Candidatus Parcubacteria bacterium]|nr:MAG: hypothetical protein KatS3mg095_0024 [Candidatus Parcubacteria bacterium]